MNTNFRAHQVGLKIVTGEELTTADRNWIGHLINQSVTRREAELHGGDASAANQKIDDLLFEEV